MKSLIAVLAAAAVLTAAAPSVAAVSYAPLTFRQDSGTRPFVATTINGKPFLMMVHGNAGDYGIITHAEAQSIGLTLTGARASGYGITHSGSVSSLGDAHAVARSLAVAGKQIADARLHIFELPQTPSTDGILGIKFLIAENAIVDFDQGRLGLADSKSDAEREDRRLVASGFTAHPMTWNPQTERYEIDGAIAGRPIHFGISTVGQNAVDSLYAQSEALPLGPVVSENGGPKGAVVPVRILRRPVAMMVDGQRVAQAQPWCWDFFAYSSEARSAGKSSQGFLGADFMLANGAVIDFATATLLLAPTSR